MLVLFLYRITRYYKYVWSHRCNFTSKNRDFYQLVADFNCNHQTPDTVYKLITKFKTIGSIKVYEITGWLTRTTSNDETTKIVLAGMVKSPMKRFWCLYLEKLSVKLASFVYCSPTNRTNTKCNYTKMWWRMIMIRNKVLWLVSGTDWECPDNFYLNGEVYRYNQQWTTSSKMQVASKQMVWLIHC